MEPKMKKISFLIAAHNEEKIISKTLENLINLPYPNYEVIIGLDGCTDKTESIVKSFIKRSSRFKYFSLNLREGKHKVINYIIKKAKGEIIIINDADWIFNYINKKILYRFVSVFDDPKIGGIAEHFPVEWDENNLKNSNFGYKMVAYSSFFWFKYQKERFTQKINGQFLLKSPMMSLTNIFRRKLYKENVTLGDDFERTEYIMQKGYNIVLFDTLEMPRMVASYDRIKIRDLIKQKIRTAIARKQINKLTKSNINIKNYYLSSITYILRNAWRDGLYTGLLVTLWVLIAIYGQLMANLTKIKSTSEAWKLRARV
jgi:glycosyltransferase involved in cell wall biosynthesis